MYKFHKYNYLKKKKNRRINPIKNPFKSQMYVQAQKIVTFRETFYLQNILFLFANSVEKQQLEK